MTTAILKPIIAICAIIFSALSLSFVSSKDGGDVYEVYQNNKLLFRQAVHDDEITRTISLNKANARDQLTIRYSHCGVTGKSRKLYVMAKGKTAKEWTFEDKGESMHFSVAAIQSSEKELRLYYASKEIPKGHLIANIAMK